MDDELVLTIPSFIGSAVREYTARSVASNKAIQAYDEINFLQHLAVASNLLATRFGITPDQDTFKKHKINDHTKAYEIYGAFNRTSRCQIILINESISEVCENGIDSFADGDDDKFTKIIKKWATNEDDCTAQEKCTFVIACGNGRGMSFPFEDPGNPNWDLIFLAIPDLHMLCSSRLYEIDSIWQLLRKEDELRTHRISIVARPICGTGIVGDYEFIYAPALVAQSFSVLLDRLFNGDYPPELFRSNEMKSWIGMTTQMTGKLFEESIANEFEDLGYSTQINVPMTQLGADKTYGDIDVLAWNDSSNVILLIECKNLRFAKTVAEIGEQLREFKGRGMDRLARHIRRNDFLKQNPQEILRITGKSSDDFILRPILITSAVVPMQFVSDFPIPTHDVIPATDIESAVLEGHFDT